MNRWLMKQFQVISVFILQIIMPKNNENKLDRIICENKTIIILILHLIVVLLQTKRKTLHNTQSLHHFNILLMSSNI